MDYLMRMYANQRDPQNSGDTHSWFHFYKWMVEGEVHFDISEEQKNHFYRDIKEGDRLWFFFSDAQRLVGYVTVLRVMEDPTRDMWEIWYNGEDCHKYTTDLEDPRPEPLMVGTFIREDIAQQWLTHCDMEKKDARPTS